MAAHPAGLPDSAAAAAAALLLLVQMLLEALAAMAAQGRHHLFLDHPYPTAVVVVVV